MTIYTVSSTDDTMSSPLDTNVEGSYTSRAAALDACVAYIFWRMELRDDLVWAMAHDENHPEAGRFFVEHRDRTIGVRKGCVNRLKEFVRDVLGGDGNYNVYDGADFTMHFEVQESALKGGLLAPRHVGRQRLRGPGLHDAVPGALHGRGQGDRQRRPVREGPHGLA